MKRYVLVGTGSRAVSAYLIPVSSTFSDSAKICGVYDISKKRAQTAVGMSDATTKVYDDFDEMLKAEKPDAVIVTSIDATHNEYIVRALKAGFDVISEKPITTTPEKLAEIRAAQKESGKNLTITFNCRYMNHFARIKEILLSGVIGKITSVHYEWLLDRNHGASYFRRWHRERKNSGSLLIHKSTHHFDLLNWFLDDEPMMVNAFGNRSVYGDEKRMKSYRCLDCPEKKECEYFYDINSDPTDKALYRLCEDDGGYVRDKCVFSPEIDIEDNVCVNIRYKGGAVASYTLTAHSPYEGVKLVLNGEKGRLEFCAIHSGQIFGGSLSNELTICYPDGEVQKTLIPTPKGDHGGADTKMLEDIIKNTASDPLGKRADFRAGAMAASIGMACNLSMSEHRSVSIDEVVKE